MSRIGLIIIAVFFSVSTYAQLNDNCANAIELTDVTDFCSQVGEGSNENTTDEGYSPATCQSSTINDVWFTFTALSSDVVITIRGNAVGLPGGTLSSPEVALYSGDCAALTQLACKNDPGFTGIAELYKGGLTPGQQYFIRVDGFDFDTGTFQYCINNYDPIPQPNGDCPTGVVLCNEQGFTVQAVSGPGSTPGELDDAPCFQGLVSETNTTWYVWTAANSGTLEFTLTPTNPNDDLDFVVYRLPNGPGDCSNKIVERCMAAGDFVATSPCMGPTGLDPIANDFSQPPGCLTGDDNFLAPLNMVAGETYALAINNFTSTGNGFSVDFGGTGTFLGPDAAFTDTDDNDTICIGEHITFKDASTFPLGNIVGWNWFFGIGANPVSGQDSVDQDVFYTSAGTKIITLTVQSEQGCLITVSKTIHVIQCCTDLSLDISGVDPACHADSNGVVIVQAQNGFPDYNYTWNTGVIGTDTLNHLGGGDYSVTVTDAFGCSGTASFTLTDPDLLTVSAVGDTTIFIGSPVTLSATSSFSSASFLWTWPDNSVAGPSVQVTPTDSTVYIVTAQNGPCTAFDTVSVGVRKIKAEIPSAFTPNNDDKNDLFRVYAEGVTILDFKIYDRWGELVYDDPAGSWDGTENDKDLPSDVYLYRISIKFPDGHEEVKTGDVTLIR